MTSSLIANLKAEDKLVIVYTNSVLGFVPMAVVAVATKAGIHSYTLPQRFLLKNSKVRVPETAPPSVRSDLMNNRNAKEAMSLDQFIAETMSALKAMPRRSLSK